MFKYFKVFLVVFFTLIVNSILGQTQEISLLFDTSGYSESNLGHKVSVLKATKGDTLPSVNGEAIINASGGFNYIIPIDVLKGVNEFSPNIALSYDSQSRNGIAGWGWNISGLSSITVGSKSIYIDGSSQGAKFDGNDPYYLDGGRLLTSDGVNFTTLLHSKIKIKKLKGKDYSFIIYYPNGKVAKYKELLPENHMISEMLDPYNNQVKYEYSVESGNIYLTKISYGSSGTKLRNFVTFKYKNRFVTQTKYLRGKEVINGKILNNIIVSTPGKENEIFRIYRLEYDLIHQNSVERLIQVDVENQFGEKLKPLKFTYTGKGDSGKIKYDSRPVNIPRGAKGLGDVVLGDFLGNGETFPIYEIEVPSNNGSKGSQLINLWNPRKGKVAEYDKSKHLFAGKAIVNKTVNKKKERVISEGDMLISLTNNYLNYKHNYTLQFYDLSGNVSVDQNSLNFSVPKVKMVKNSKLKGKSIEPKILIKDFNNDGLVDLLIFNPRGNHYKSMSNFYFCEIGKLDRNGQQIELNELKYDANVSFHLFTDVYPIDFDGDGASEFMTVDKKGKINMLKLNLEDFSISKLDIGLEKLENFSEDTPIIFGDFNGDGLVDFVTPVNIFTLEGSSAESELKKMNTTELLWWAYVSTGKEIKKEQKNFTKQKLAYIKPSQNNVIKRSSKWQKFWSGKPDRYLYTEYGASNILAIDINGDGVTDLVSFRKFGKINYQDNLFNSKFNNDLGFESPLKDRDGVQFYTVLPSQNGSFQVADGPVRNSDGTSGISLANKKISPLSLILNKSDFNTLNSYKNGIIIHDPVVKRELYYVVDNDGFVEGQLKEIDNSSGSKQVIEYRSMSEYNNDEREKIYTYSELKLPYPYFVHKANGSHYLVHKTHIQYQDKILTKEYRYHNAIQHLQGKGFIGFQKTKISEVYESIKSNKDRYIIKDIFRGVFWRINTYDPLMDNAQISAAYGSLNESSLFSKTTFVNKKFNRANQSYLVLPVSERTEDFLNGFVINKKNFYEDSAEDLLLIKSLTNYYSPTLDADSSRLTSSVMEEFSYLPEFSGGKASNYFYGLLKETKIISRRDNHTFISRDEYSYNTQGAISTHKKYGNGTNPIITEYDYYNFGAVKSEKVYTNDIAPLITSYKYDPSNRYVVESISPDGLKSTAKIDVFGKILSEKDGLGRTTSYKYDSWGNVHTIIDYLGNKFRTKKKDSRVKGARYDVHTIGSDNAQTITSYDLFDRVIQTKTKSLNNKWLVTKQEYDVYGNVIKSSQPYFEGEVAKWNYTIFDRLNRPIEVIDYLGKSFKTYYEKNKITVEDGHKKSSKWVDALGVVLKIQDQGGVILNKYYANGSLKESNYDGIKTIIFIDGWGNKTRLVDPSAGTYTYEYDNFNRIKKTTNPKGGSTNYKYDSLGRIISEVTSGGTDEDTTINVDYKYDDKTKQLSNVRGNYNGMFFSYNTQYDVYGRVLNKTENTPKFTYTNNFVYDKFGRVDQVELKTTLKDINVTSISKVTRCAF